MLAADAGALLLRGSEERAAGKGSGATEQPARALVDRRDGFIAEQLLFTAVDSQMLREVGGHVVSLQGLAVCPAHDAGCEWAGGLGA